MNLRGFGGFGLPAYLPLAPQTGPAPSEPSEQPFANGAVGVSDDRLLQVFQQSSEGWSLDEVLAHPARRERVAACLRAEMGNDRVDGALIRLLALRKRSGGGGIKVLTRRRSGALLRSFAVELAVVLAYARTQKALGASTDSILCRTRHRASFLQHARLFAPDASEYGLLKSLLMLRKRKLLRPGRRLPVDPARTDWIEQGSLEAAGHFDGPAFVRLREPERDLLVWEALGDSSSVLSFLRADAFLKNIGNPFWAPRADRLLLSVLPGGQSRFSLATIISQLPRRPVLMPDFTAA